MPTFHNLRVYLGGAHISGIGPERTAILQSYGIDTADDVTPAAVMAVPGFGTHLAINLVRWRLGIEKRFAFDPKKGIDPADIALLEQAVLTAKAKLERTLSKGAADLDQIRQRILLSRHKLTPAVTEAGKD